MRIPTLQFLALLVTALALVPAGAHLFAMSTKMAMSQADYFTVQGIYAGWALFGLLWFAGLAVLAALAYLTRAQARPMWLALAALASIILMLAVFFLWTFPANQATQNWTTPTPDWETLRRNWEYSHAANAFIAFASFLFTVLAVLSWQTRRGT